MTSDDIFRLAKETGLWEIFEKYSNEFGNANPEEDCLPDLEQFVARLCASQINKFPQKPIAWGMPGRYNRILDAISPEEHDRAEGQYIVPLYALPFSQASLAICKAAQQALEALEWLNNYGSDKHGPSTFGAADALRRALKEIKC